MPTEVLRGVRKGGVRKGGVREPPPPAPPPQVGAGCGNTYYRSVLSLRTPCPHLWGRGWGWGLASPTLASPTLASPTEHFRRHVLRVPVVGAGSDCWLLVGSSPREMRRLPTLVSLQSDGRPPFPRIPAYTYWLSVLPLSRTLVFGASRPFDSGIRTLALAPSYSKQVPLALPRAIEPEPDSAQLTEEFGPCGRSISCHRSYPGS